MTVWSSSIVIEPDTKGSDADAGSFRSTTTQGTLAAPNHLALGDYPILKFGGGIGGTIAGQGGNVSIY